VGTKSSQKIRKLIMNYRNFPQKEELDITKEEGFLYHNSIDGGFLQSRFWKSFQSSLGRQVLLFDKRKKGFWGLVVEHCLPLVGKYWFFPRGPIFSKEKDGLAMNEFLLLVEKIAKEKSANWIRIEPQRNEDIEKIKRLLKEKKYEIRKAKKNHEPAQTLILDISKGEEEILHKMKPKTRYNIRLAKRKGVKVYCYKNQNDLRKFFSLVEQTARRNKIAVYSFDYYRKMLAEIGRDRLELFLAEFKGKIIGGIMVSFFGKTAIYLHGATSNSFRNVMAMYLLQWEAIKEAKKRKCEKYDFNGINPKNQKSPNFNKSWEGISRFKTSFAPREKITEFPGCWDIVLDKKKYQAYRFFQSIKNFLKQNIKR